MVRVLLAKDDVEAARVMLPVIPTDPLPPLALPTCIDLPLSGVRKAFQSLAGAAIVLRLFFV